VIFHKGALVNSSSNPTRILTCVKFISTIITIHIPVSIVVLRDFTGITLNLITT
jgi:hypothetical protein